jgi:Zn finger protein HypA/HybF involved in hydrogenase expression
MPTPKKPLKLCRNCQKEVKRPVAVFCCMACQHLHEYDQFIYDWLRGVQDGTCVGGISNHVRRYLLLTHCEKCTICGWNKTNPVTGRVPLEVDHINGDHSNSTKENLRLICPNCHSLTPTFRNLNKGKGREYRMARLLSSAGRAPTL